MEVEQGVEILPAPWDPVVSQDGRQERSPQESSHKRQRFMKPVHRGTHTKKGKDPVAPREKLAQVFKGARRGKSWREAG